MKPPRVSVLVPCYQSAKFVGRALESVRAQSFHDWEVVAVDNASDDETHFLLEEYARRDGRIRVFRNTTNVGPVRNWRRCAELARGELATLLFSDDWLEDEYLARSIAPFDENPAIGFVYSAVRIVRDPGAPEGPGSSVAYQRDGGVRETSEFLRAIYERRGASAPVSPGCAVFRLPDLRKWLEIEFERSEEIGYLRHGAGPDVAIYVQACLEHATFAHIRDPLVNFRAHGSNLSWKAGVKLAYALALHELYSRHETRMPVDRSRALAVLAFRLRSSDVGRRILRGLDARGWAYVALVAANSTVARLRRALE